MKTIAFIFLSLLSVVGCSNHARPGAGQQIQQWVPDNASLVTVQEIMEQHHFNCSVQNYTNSQVANAPDGELIGQVFNIKGQQQVVTNVCYLMCVGASNSPCGQATFTFINQKYIRLSTSSGLPAPVAR